MTLDAVRDLLLALSNKADLVKPVGLQASDARPALLTGVQQIIGGLYVNVNALCNAPAGLTIDALTKTITKDGRDITQESLDAYWRLSLITLVCFKFDALFADILDELPGPPAERSFGGNVRRITTATTLATPQLAKDTFLAAASIRNSMHNNGIHKGQALTVTVNHRVFDFQPGAPVQCASMEEVCHVLDACLDLIGEILASQEVSALQHVPDEGVRQFTGP